MIRGVHECAWHAVPERLAASGQTRRATNMASRQPKDETERVKGPASYFPSIEKTYGRPIGEWLDLVRASDIDRHMDLVNWLKSEHGLGHGHANAIVAYVKAQP